MNYRKLGRKDVLKLSLLSVNVYVEGATNPVVSNPCRNQEQADALKAKIEAQVKANGWNHIVRIERKKGLT